jgi:hypothetical protein
VNAKLRCRLLVAVLVAAAAFAGCSAFQGKPLLDSAAGMFDKADVSYRVETARINQHSPQASRAEGQLVSYQSATERPLPPDALADVQIAFPHPQKREGYAQVTVRLFDASAADTGRMSQWWKSGLKLTGLSGEGQPQETWMLDIPQNELAGIINDLHNSGFFTSYDKPAEGPQIQTKLDGAKVSKTWRQVPQLDALIVRVRSQGRLLSSPKGEAGDLFQGLAGPTPSSVAVYRKLNEDEGVAIASDADQSPLTDPAALQVVRLPPVGMLR